MLAVEEVEEMEDVEQAQPMPQGCIFELVISQDEHSMEDSPPIAVRLQFA